MIILTIILRFSAVQNEKPTVYIIIKYYVLLQLFGIFHERPSLTIKRPGNYYYRDAGILLVELKEFNLSKMYKRNKDETRFV